MVTPARAVAVRRTKVRRGMAAGFGVFSFGVFIVQVRIGG
jgi:hypothetical protein